MKMTANSMFRFVVVLLLVAVMAGLVFCIVKVTDTGNTKTLNATNWQIGSIDEETAEYVKDTGSIITRDYIPLDGLEICLQKNANVSVTIVLLDKNHDYVEPTTDTIITLEPDKDEVVKTAYADYKDAVALLETKPTCALVIVTPKHDSEVSWNEIAGYAKQVTVSYSK